MNSNNIVNSPEVLAALRQRKRTIEKKLQDSRSQMTENASYLTGGKAPKTVSNLQGISRIISGGLVLYQCFRICSGVVSGIHSIFTPRKRRR